MSASSTVPLLTGINTLLDDHEYRSHRALKEMGFVERATNVCQNPHMTTRRISSRDDDDDEVDDDDSSSDEVPLSSESISELQKFNNRLAQV